MFVGEFVHSVDSKGRLVLPSKYRDQLDGGCVITKGQDRCLYVFSIPRWEVEMERVRGLPRTDRKFRNYARAFFAGASNQEVDGQGRIQIPPPLRSYAGLERDVVVAGVGEWVELWDVNTWQEVTVEADSYYADIEEALSDQGI